VFGVAITPAFNARNTAVTVFASAPWPTRTITPSIRPRSFLHRAQPGAAAFCVDGGLAEKTMPRLGQPERTEALQYAKAQSGTLATPVASQTIAVVKVRAVGATAETESPLAKISAIISAFVLGAPRSPATCTGELLKPMNRLSVSIIHCVHSKPRQKFADAVPPDIQQRLAGLSIDELEAMSERVIGADSIEDILTVPAPSTAPQKI
jgi:hypothetical protein